MNSAFYKSTVRERVLPPLDVSVDAVVKTVVLCCVRWFVKSCLVFQHLAERPFIYPCSVSRKIKHQCSF